MAQSVGDDVKNSLGGPFRSAVNKVSGWLGDTSKPAFKKVDESYSRDMLKRANDSFAKQGVGTKAAPKPAPKKGAKKPMKKYGK